MSLVKIFEHKFHIVDLGINLGFVKRFPNGEPYKGVNMRS